MKLLNTICVSISLSNNIAISTCLYLAISINYCTMDNNLYFDNAASTLISDNALNEYIKACKTFGNPSAKHHEGEKAKNLLEENRIKIAKLLKVPTKSIYFTSGGSESISIVLSSLLRKRNGGQIITSKIEHRAVLGFENALKEKDWTIVKLNAKKGYVDPSDIEQNITSDTKLVAIQLVNSVTGAIQDIKSIVNIVRNKEKELNKKIFILCDTVQALGKVDFNLVELDVDAAAFSAHKIYGPRGIGLLYLKDNNINVLSSAGGQESLVRGGTENVPAIAAFAKALEDIFTLNDDNVKQINKKMREIFALNNIKVLSSEENSSPFILSITTGLPAEVLTRILSDQGYAVSSGSACSSKARSKNESILLAMNFTKNDAMGVIRISYSHYSTIEDGINLANAIVKAVKEFN